MIFWHNLIRRSNKDRCASFVRTRSEVNRVRGRNKQSRAKLQIIVKRAFWLPLNALLKRASMAALLIPLTIPASTANPTLTGEYRNKNRRSFIAFPKPRDEGA